MKRPFKEAPAIWQAIVVAAIVITIAFIVSICGCASGAKRPSCMAPATLQAPPLAPAPPAPLMRRPPIPPPPMPPLRKVDRSKTTLKKAADLNENGGNGSDVAATVRPRTYEAACSNNFATCRIEWHPCETNQFELWETLDDGTNVTTIGRWYSGTNVLSWLAEAGHIYVPEWTDGSLAPPGGPIEGGLAWYSFCYLSTPVPAVLTITNLHYIDEGGPIRLWRIRREEAQFPFAVGE